MAVTQWIPDVWAARFVSTLRASLVYEMFVNRNYRGNITMAGDTVKVPIWNKSFTVRNYVKGTALVAPEESDGSTVDLNIDKQKYVNFEVDDIDALQAEPDLMDRAMYEAAYNMASQIDDDLQTTFNGTYNASRSIRVTEAFTADDVGEKLIEGVISLRRMMSTANLPMEMRMLTAHPDTIAILDAHFATKPADGVYLPATSESTIANGFSGKLLGFDLYQTTKVPTVDVSSVDYHRLFAVAGNEAVTFADQLVEVEPYRPHDGFSDAIKMLNVYGSLAVVPNRVYTLEHQQA